MRKFLKNKIWLILILSQFLSSCALTRAMWGRDSEIKGDTISSFFIDKEHNRIVLIGDEKDEKGNDHYSINEPTGKFVKVFELAQKSNTDIGLSLLNGETNGEKVYGGLFIKFKIVNLSKEDLEFIKKNKLIHEVKKDYVGFGSRLTSKDDYKSLDAQTMRYPSSQEPVKNLCSYEPAEYITIDKGQTRSRENIIPKEPLVKIVSQPKLKSSNNPDCIPVTFFDQPWKGIIQDQYTVGQKIGRVAATPFTFVADIILTPLYLIGIIGMGVGK